MFSQLFFKIFSHRFSKGDNWHEQDPKTGDWGYGWIYYSLVRQNKPKNILCIGSKYGFVPAALALACKDNKYGKVIFVDAGYDTNNPDHVDIHWDGVGFWKTRRGKNQFNIFGMGKYIDIKVMTTQDFFKKYPKEKWDYIHIDGDHSYKGVKHDFKYSWRQLRPGGIVSLHDIFTTSEMGGLDYGVGKLWQELKKRHNVIEFNGVCGLGLIQK